MNDTIYICAAAYLLGSIPFGLLLTRLAGLGDIRTIGSGNIGATNVLRTGRKALAATTLLLDALKGTVAVLLAAFVTMGDPAPTSPVFGHEQEAYALGLSVAALLALLGHCFPVWLKFRGGKGVATLLGIWLALSPYVFLWMVISWAAGAFGTRRSSVGALTACLALPPLAYWLAPQYLSVALIMMAIVVLKHRANIARIVAGTEPQIGKA